MTKSVLLSVMMESSIDILRLSSGTIVAHPTKKLEFIVNDATSKITLFDKGIKKLMSILLDNIDDKISEATCLAEKDINLHKVTFSEFLSQFGSTAYVFHIQTYNGKPYCFIKRFFTVADNPSEWIPTKLMFKIDVDMLNHFKHFLEIHYPSSI